MGDSGREATERQAVDLIEDGVKREGCLLLNGLISATRGFRSAVVYCDSHAIVRGP